MPGATLPTQKLLTTQLVSSVSFGKLVSLSDRELDVVDCVIAIEIQTNEDIQRILAAKVKDTLDQIG